MGEGKGEALWILGWVGHLGAGHNCIDFGPVAWRGELFLVLGSRSLGQYNMWYTL